MTEGDPIVILRNWLLAEKRAEPTAEQIREVLRTSGGQVTEAARALGMSSRFALYRLMKKLGIAEGRS